MKPLPARIVGKDSSSDDRADYPCDEEVVPVCPHGIRIKSISRMTRANTLLGLALYLTWAAFSTGCGSYPISSSRPPSGPSEPGPKPEVCAGGVALNIRQPSIYLVNASTSPNTIIVFPKTASGETPLTAEVPGSQVSLDDAGDIFIVSPSGSCIAEYPSASSVGAAARFLPVGPGKNISAVSDMAVSATGEIFVSDGQGVAVFSATATDGAHPERYILGVTSAGVAIRPVAIAVDHQDNLYVDEGNSSVAVFGPTANGSQTPSRSIKTGAEYILGMSTDSEGNLYVLCVGAGSDGTGVNDFGVIEFGPTATGNAEPIRRFTSPTMYPWTGGPGIAVDSAGIVYVAAGTPTGTQTVFEFSADASGSVPPFNTITSPTWIDTAASSIAVH